MIALALLDGCALGKVGINHTPQKDVAPVPGADRVAVKLEVVDARLIRDRIGQIQFDANHGKAVLATNDPVSAVKQAVGNELINRGFTLSDNGVALVIYLQKMYAVFNGSESSGTVKNLDAIAEVSVRVKKSDGTVIYHTVATGKVEKHEPQPKEEAALAISQALDASLAHLFADSSFLNALLNAPGSPQNSG